MQICYDRLALDSLIFKILIINYWVNCYYKYHSWYVAQKNYFLNKQKDRRDLRQNAKMFICKVSSYAYTQLIINFNIKIFSLVSILNYYILQTTVRIRWYKICQSHWSIRLFFKQKLYFILLDLFYCGSFIFKMKAVKGGLLTGK